MAEFKKGDTVRLKSGGPTMTVENVDDPEQVVCIWFERTELNRDIFDPATLKVDELKKIVGARMV